jgi:hypothetical protein
MSLFEQIRKDMYQAMKAGDKTAAATLRSALARLQDRRIEKRSDLTEAETIRVLQSLIKQRKESIALYRQGDREDLVQQEQAEIDILETYLPRMLSEAEIRDLVNEVVREIGASSPSDIGKVMPLVMQRGAGRVDGKTAQRIVRELLQ